MGAAVADNSSAKRQPFITRYGALTGVGIYTLIFAIFTAITSLTVIIDTGTLLGGDGIAQYYPFFLEFRRNTIAFFESLFGGSPQLNMIDLNFCFGTDTITGTTMIFLPFFPVYAISALLPEAAVPLLYALVSLVLSYLAGLAFIYMCRHFGVQPLWSGVFAPAYVFCGNYFFTGLFNPQFLYMYIAFPLMIVGMDRMLNGKGWKLFVLTVFWLSLGGFTALIYTLPFVVVFALIRVYFLYKEHYFKALIKYFLRGCGAVLLGAAMAGVVFLPLLMEYFGSTRADIGNVDLVSLLIPDMEYLTETLATGSQNSPTGILALLVPCLVHMLCVRGKRELRIYVLVTLVLVAFPVIRYGLNGFQYALCRWGFIPALVITFCCAAYMPIFMRSGKRTMKRFLPVLVIYVAAVTLMADELAVVFLIAMAVLQLFSPTRRLVSKAAGLIGALWKKLKEKKLLLYGLCILLVPIVLFAAITVIKTKHYDIQPALLLAAAATVVAILFVSYRKKLVPVVSSVLAAVLVLCGTLQLPIRDKQEYCVLENDELFQYFYEECGGNPFDRVMANMSVFSLIDTTEDDKEIEEDNESADAETEYSYDPQINASTRYDIAAPSIFKSLINSNYSAFMRRCGMDGTALASTLEVSNYAGKEVLYSLFGIDRIYSYEVTDLYYGFTHTESFVYSDGTAMELYRNEYALPAGVTYDRFMSREQYEALDPAGLPYAMLDSVYAEGYEYSENAAQPQREYARESAFEHTSSLRGENQFGIEVYDNTIHILDDVTDHFLYLYFDGVKNSTYDELLVRDVGISIDDSRFATYYVHNQTSSWPWDYVTDHYTFSLGYCKEGVKTLTFITPFEYENMRVYAVPASVYTDAVNARRSEALQNIQCSENTVTGEITVSGDRLLSVGLLYNKGWTAYVDGEKTPIYKANGLFLGIPLEEGSHTITLRYCTPWLLQGAAVSVASIILFCVLALMSRRKRSEKA